MDSWNQEKDIKALALRAKMMGGLYFCIFFVLIILGIIQKRVYHQEGFMMLWHVPAAVFLVLSGRNWGFARRIEYFKLK